MTGIVLQLPTARSLATIDVARLTDSRSYARGVEYLRRGVVSVAHQTSTAVDATVLGTKLYDVSLSMGVNGLDSSCSCPIGSDGGFCKHLVAVALTVTDDEAVDAGEPVSVAELRSWLDTLSRSQLVEVLVEAADHDEELRTHLAHRRHAVTAAAAPADLTTYRQAIAARLAASGLDDAAPCCWAQHAHEVIDEVEALLATGYATEVIEFCEFAVNCLEANAPEIFGADDELVGLAVRLGDLHCRACHDAPPEPVALAGRLFAAETRGDLGAFAGAVERYAGVLGADGLAEYTRRAEAAWRGRKGWSDLALSIERFRIEPIMRSLDQVRRGGS